MTDQEFYSQIHFFIRLQGNADSLEICPVIVTETDRARTLVASFSVDGMEMIESVRITLNAGKNVVPFPKSMQIIHPQLWYPKNMGAQSVYTFSLDFYQAGDILYRIKQQFALKSVKRDAETHQIHLNGMVWKDTAASIILSDDDPALDEKLNAYGAEGKTVILKITGTVPPEYFGHRPGVCAFTAEPDSPGSRFFNTELDPLLPPFFPLQELNDILQDK